jgi:hypothetical protein
MTWDKKTHFFEDEDEAEKERIRLEVLGKPGIGLVPHLGCYCVGGRWVRKHLDVGWNALGCILKLRGLKRKLHALQRAAGILRALFFGSATKGCHRQKKDMFKDKVRKRKRARIEW